MSEQKKEIVTAKELETLERTCNLILNAAFLMDDLLEELATRSKEKGIIE
jgi:hypothetical protein